MHSSARTNITMKGANNAHNTDVEMMESELLASMPKVPPHVNELAITRQGPRKGLELRHQLDDPAQGRHGRHIATLCRLDEVPISKVACYMDIMDPIDSNAPSSITPFLLKEQLGPLGLRDNCSQNWTTHMCAIPTCNNWLLPLNKQDNCFLEVSLSWGLNTSQDKLEGHADGALVMVSFKELQQEGIKQPCPGSNINAMHHSSP